MHKPSTQTHTHMHGQSETTHRKNKKKSNINIHTYRATRTYTVIQCVEQACWVAVSTYSAAMATSSMDSAAKWVRVCECDNLVKITFKPNVLHTHTHTYTHIPLPLHQQKLHLLAWTVSIRLSVASNSWKRKSSSLSIQLTIKTGKKMSDAISKLL